MGGGLTPDQDRLCSVVQPILRWGMVLSLCLMLLGLVLGLATGEGEYAAVPMGELPSRLAELDPTAFLTLGIVMLIATPLARVLGSLYVFIKEGDGRFVLVSLVVLFTVALSVLLGAA
ncbi:MAG TPA: DUF1634 domain-containing protein [Methanomassiliicoccales archaeon]|nr:DUF1634 domain-containing protein [Methanomassiliicoccales archaeon]MCE5261236.1 DUF1634 domain-containing protein [Euryarchaeota archaeon]HOE52169.1 DUF1634 domain-containing protein [Methanomassiliicoccales archaeon]HOO03336.1 DUF1634 domain-containing protein [Methanomassiliicoccales archaeon]HQM67001.1 DUF1634 domain-containing protein [Methanomassiliicoccales archaeon]